MTLSCNHCGNVVAIIKGRLFVHKKGLVCYCKECDTMRSMMIKPKVDIPSIFEEIFRKS